MITLRIKRPSKTLNQIVIDEIHLNNHDLLTALEIADECKNEGFACYLTASGK